MEQPPAIHAADIDVNASYDSMASLFAQVEKEEVSGILFASGKDKKTYRLDVLKGLHKKFTEGKIGLMAIPSGNSIHMRNQEVLDLLRGGGVSVVEKQIRDGNLPTGYEVIWDPNKKGMISVIKFDFDKGSKDFPEFDEKTLERGMTIDQLRFFLAACEINYDHEAEAGRAVTDGDIKPDMIIYAEKDLKADEFKLGFKPSELIFKAKN